MTGRGRPSVDDKKKNQYRVLLNDQEKRILNNITKSSGLKKSEVLRNAVKDFFNKVQLLEINPDYYDCYDYVSMKRVINCPYCETGNIIDLKDYCTGDYERERQLGPVIQHSLECENYQCVQCDKTFTISGFILEYPIGVFNNEHIVIRKDMCDAD